MPNVQCPNCGHETAPAAPCPGCGSVEKNGTAARPEPVPPPEAAGWKIEHASPDVLARARQTFDETEFLAAKREIEPGGGHRFEDFIDEFERITNGGE